MKHESVSKMASQLGKLAKGKKKNITEQERERRREQMRKVAVKGRAKLARIRKGIALLLASLLIASQAQAIPLSALEDQACLKARIEVQMSALPFGGANTDRLRSMLRDYMAGIKANIEQMKRDGDDPEAVKARKEYEADLQWAQNALKKAVGQ